MIKNRFYYYLFFFIFFFNLAVAEEKGKIIENLKNYQSLEFSFLQITNENSDIGFCYLNFPGKLKCNYDDNKKKELLINGKDLYITQKRYNKTSYYPLTKSPYLKILNKIELIKIIKKSEIKYLKDKIILINSNNKEKKINIFFDRNDLSLKGWEIEDQFKNNVTFLIEIISINKEVGDDKFQPPILN